MIIWSSNIPDSGVPAWLRCPRRSVILTSGLPKLRVERYKIKRWSRIKVLLQLVAARKLIKEDFHLIFTAESKKKRSILFQIVRKKGFLIPLFASSNSQWQCIWAIDQSKPFHSLILSVYSLHVWFFIPLSLPLSIYGAILYHFFLSVFVPVSLSISFPVCLFLFFVCRSLSLSLSLWCSRLTNPLHVTMRKRLRQPSTHLLVYSTDWSCQKLQQTPYFVSGAMLTHLILSPLDD